MEYLLGIDIGSSATKVGLFSTDGAAVAVATRSQSPGEPRPGYKEQDAEQWWQAAAEGIREVCAAAGPAPIVGIGAAGQISSLTFVDAAGAPLRPTVCFQDLRAVAEVEEVQAAFGRAELARRLGIDLPPAATWPLPRLVWFRKHEPSMIERACCVLQAKDYVNFRLTGELASDASSNRGVIDLATGRAPREVFERLGLPERLAPRIAGPFEVIGRVTAAAARETGLAAGIPVAAGWNDLNAAVLGSGVVEPGRSFNITGTSEHIGTVVAGDHAVAELVSAPFLDGRKLLYGVTSSGGGSLEWYHQAFQRGFDDLLRAAAAAPPGCDGLLFLPYLQGERAPIWDPLAAGVFAGIRSGHGEGHFVRAILEGVAFSLRQILELVERHASASAQPLIISGGAARVPLWNRIKADVLERAVAATEPPHAGALGAAMLAAVATGRHSSCDAAARAMVRPGGGVDPDARLTPLYRHSFARYCALYPALRSWFAEGRPDFIDEHA